MENENKTKIDVGDEVIYQPEGHDIGQLGVVGAFLEKDKIILCSYDGSKPVMLKDCRKSKEDYPIEELNHPPRYVAGTYECIEVASAIIDEYHMSGKEAICTFNGLKYFWRWKLKTPRASLKKAIVSAQKLLKHIEQHPDLYPKG